MLREKELAELDRLDPPIELSADQRVRRLISRFRRLSCSRSATSAVGLALTDMSPGAAAAGDTLSTEMSSQAFAGRKTHSVDATSCSPTDLSNPRPPATDATNSNNCTVSNGGSGVSAGRAAWKRLISRASSMDVTAAAAPATAIALPGNGQSARVVSGTATGSGEERALLSDDSAPHRSPPRSKWNCLLSPAVDTTTKAAAVPRAAADNEVFDDEDLCDDSSPVKSVAVGHSPTSADRTVELRATFLLN